MLGFARAPGKMDVLDSVHVSFNCLFLIELKPCASYSRTELTNSGPAKLLIPKQLIISILRISV
jgi:hypothetical protein